MTNHYYWSTDLWVINWFLTGQLICNSSHWSVTKWFVIKIFLNHKMEKKNRHKDWKRWNQMDPNFVPFLVWGTTININLTHKILHYEILQKEIEFWAKEERLAKQLQEQELPISTSLTVTIPEPFPSISLLSFSLIW